MSISKNLLALYNRASIDTINNGLCWYNEANNLAYKLKELAQGTLDIDTIAQVISALSPACSWENNKLDAERLILYWLMEREQEATVCTYGRNKAKAISILYGRDTINKQALKTYAFYRNIMLDSSYITIDRHAYKALVGKQKAGTEKLTPARYTAAVKAYKDTAKHLGLKGYELQAIIWLQYKLEKSK